MQTVNNQQTIRGGKSKPRNFGIDLVRIFAVLFVMSGHFFSLNTEFKTSEFHGFSMFLQSIGAFAFRGVPLYLMLSGFLNFNKTLSKSFYKGCRRILISYVFFSIVTILFRELYLHQHNSIIGWGHEILKFSAIPYAWYIEMWIGLFLMTPFLNKAYHALDSRRHKHILIMTLSALTFLPHLTNRYGLHLFPDFWKQTYPLTFYFIGMYIREYKPVVNKAKALTLIIALASINGLFSMFVLHSGKFVQIAGDSYGILGAILAVTLFVTLYDIKSPSELAGKALQRVAKLSLDMYMCNFMMDSLVYPWFKERFFVDQAQFGAWFFVIIPILFTGAFILAQTKDWLFHAISAIPLRWNHSRNMVTG